MYNDKSLQSLAKIALISLIIFLFFYGFISWHDFKIKQKSYISQQTINGRGSAEIKAIPNVAVINFTVTKTQKTSQEASLQMQKTANDALDSLAKNNVDKIDIKTLDFSTYPQYESQIQPCKNNLCPPAKSVITGFVASQKYFVKIRDISKGSLIINDLTNAGVDEISGLNFVIDSIEDIKNEARIKAIDNAKAQALKTANALGVKLTKIIKYYDEDNYHQPYLMARASSISNAESTQQLLPSEETIKSTIVIIYEFE